MSKRILELEVTYDPEFPERIVVLDKDNYISIFSEYYQKYSWKEPGWYSSPDEGSSFPKIALPAIIEALQKLMNNKT